MFPLPSPLIDETIFAKKFSIPPTPQKKRYREILTEGIAAWQESQDSKDFNTSLIQNKIQTLVELRFQCHYLDSFSYYNTGCNPAGSKTILQGGGSGRKDWHANHVALLPELKDDGILKMTEQLVVYGMTERMKKYLSKRGASEDDLRDLEAHRTDADFIGKFFDTKWPGNLQKSIIAGSRYERLKNVTVSLPKLVNQYDSTLEQKFRPKALDLVQQCAQRILTPEQSVCKLQQEMHQFFNEGKKAVEQCIIDLKRFKVIYEEAMVEREKQVNAQDHRPVDQKTIKELQGIKNKLVQKSLFIPGNKKTAKFLKNCVQKLQYQDQNKKQGTKETEVQTQFSDIMQRASDLKTIIEEQKKAAQFDVKSLLVLKPKLKELLAPSTPRKKKQIKK